MPFVHRLLSKSFEEQKSQEKQKEKSVLEYITGEIDWGTVLLYTCSKDCDSMAKPHQKVFNSVEFVALQIETV
jgi:hypothetical protein